MCLAPLANILVRNTLNDTLRINVSSMHLTFSWWRWEMILLTWQLLQFMEETLWYPLSAYSSFSLTNWFLKADIVIHCRWYFKTKSISFEGSNPHVAAGIAWSHEAHDQFLQMWTRAGIKRQSRLLQTFTKMYLYVIRGFLLSFWKCVCVFCHPFQHNPKLSTRKICKIKWSAEVDITNFTWSNEVLSFVPIFVSSQEKE